MRARFHRNSFSLKPVCELLRAREDSNPRVVAETITGFLTQKPRVILRIFLNDHPGRNPQLFDLEAPITLKGRKSVKMKEIIRPLGLVVIAMRETDNVKRVFVARFHMIA